MKGAAWAGPFTGLFTAPAGALRPLSGEEAEGGEAGAIGRSLKWEAASEVPCGDWLPEEAPPHPHAPLGVWPERGSLST